MNRTSESQLDEHTRKALCAADQPPLGVEDRILAAILGPAGGPGPGDGGLTSALGSGALVHAAKIVGATLGLAATGVAVLAITAAGVRAIPDPQNAEPSSVSAVATPEPRDVEVADAAASVDEPIPEAEPILDESEPTEPELPPAPPPPLTQRPSKRTSESTIEAELVLMKTARSSKDHERALAALERHRREFATGVFAAEREVLRVEHLCALGRTQEAERIAANFVVRHPDNPLRSRVELACSN